MPQDLEIWRFFIDTIARSISHTRSCYRGRVFYGPALATLAIVSIQSIHRGDSPEFGEIWLRLFLSFAFPATEASTLYTYISYLSFESLVSCASGPTFIFILLLLLLLLVVDVECVCERSHSQVVFLREVGATRTSF